MNSNIFRIHFFYSNRFSHIFTTLMICFLIGGYNMKLKYPVTVFWETSNKCNLHCLHCYTNSSPYKSEFLDKEKALKLIDEMAEHQVYSFGIGGGEPLVLPYWEEMIKHISEKGMKVSISTNGTLINADIAKRLSLAGLGAAQVSIDGTEKIHDFIRGKGNYHRAIEGIKHLINNNISVRIGFTVNRINYNDIEKITVMAKKIGCDSIVFFRYMPTSDQGKILELDPTTLYNSAKNILQAKKYISKSNNKNFLIYYERLSFLTFLINKEEYEHAKCLAGQGMCNISCNSQVTICPHLPKEVGSIWDETLGEIWARMNLETKGLYEIPDNCKDCEFSEKCRGGCKGISYILYGDYAHKDNCCYKELIK